MSVLFDEPFRELVPGCEDIQVFHLLERFPLFEGLLDGVCGSLQHFVVRAKIVETAQVTVSRNNFHVPWKLVDNFLASGNHALNTPSAVDVNERKAVADKVIAHVDHVRSLEKNDGVSVRVSGRIVKSADVFAVQVNSNIVLEGNDWQRDSRCRFVLHSN